MSDKRCNACDKIQAMLAEIATRREFRRTHLTIKGQAFSYAEPHLENALLRVAGVGYFDGDSIFIDGKDRPKNWQYAMGELRKAYQSCDTRNEPRMVALRDMQRHIQQALNADSLVETCFNPTPKWGKELQPLLYLNGVEETPEMHKDSWCPPRYEDDTLSAAHA